MEDIEITCPNCKVVLPAELKRVLVAGTAVTCENCGIVLVPKMQEEPPKVPPKKEQETVSVRQAVRKAIKEARTVIATELRRELAATSSLPQPATPSTSPARPAPPDQPAPPVPLATPLATPAAPAIPTLPTPQAAGTSAATPGTASTARVQPEGHGTARSTPRKPSRPGTPEHIAQIKQDIENAKRGLRTYNEASLVLTRLWLILFYASSILTLLFSAITGQPFFASLVQQAPLYITGAFLHWYETHRIHEWIKQGVYEFYGVDMIVVGIVGCTVYGAGVWMLIKGFIVMGIMLAQDKVTPRAKRDALISWINGLDEVSWYIAALVAAASFIIAASLVIGGIISLAMPSAQFIAFIIMGICGIVAANSDLHGVSKFCRAYQFDNLGGKSLVNGIIGSICAGAGTPMIIKAILLFVIDGLDKKHPQGRMPGQVLAEQPLPRHDAALASPLVEAGTQKPASFAGEKKPAEPAQPGIGIASEARPASPAMATAAPAAARPMKQPPTLPPKSPMSVEAFLQRSFNVLTPRVRKRLLRLRKMGVTDADLETIAAELVHHPEFQQLEIIDEYLQLNKVDEVDPVHVLAVRNMNYDENTKKWMLDQLRSIPDKDVPAFIDEMKRSQPTP